MPFVGFLSRIRRRCRDIFRKEDVSGILPYLSEEEIRAFCADASLKWIFFETNPIDESIISDWLISHPQAKGVLVPYRPTNRRIQCLRNSLPGSVLVANRKNFPESVFFHVDAAYMGRGNNPVKVAAYGLPLVFGPEYLKDTATEELIALGGAIAIKGKMGFERISDRFLYDPLEREKRGRWSREYVESLHQHNP